MNKRTRMITENCDKCNGNGFIETEIEYEIPQEFLCANCNQLKHGEGEPCQCDLASRNGD